MYINTNISALQSVNDLQNTEGQLGNVLQQLSSGYQINSAADNPAGLAISQEMQSQINGLNQAGQNAQSGISLLQTADGALSNVDSILQSMRSLASQAATGTNNPTDLQALQQEMNQYAKEITTITNTTQFNTLNLLSGAFGGSVGGSYNAEGQYAGGTQTPLQYIQIGANAGQELAIGIDPMDSASLGVTGFTSTFVSGQNGLGMASVSDLGAGLNTGSYTISMTAQQATVTGSTGLSFTGTIGATESVVYTITGAQAAESATISTATGANGLDIGNSAFTAGSGLTTGSYTVEIATTTAATITSASGVTVSGTYDGTATSTAQTFYMAVSLSGSTYTYTIYEGTSASGTVVAATTSASSTTVSFNTSTAGGMSLTLSDTSGFSTTTGSLFTATAASASFELVNGSASQIGSTVTEYGATYTSAITVGAAATNQTIEFTLGSTVSGDLAGLASLTGTYSGGTQTTFNVVGVGDWQYTVTGSDGFSTVVTTSATVTTGATNISFTDGTLGVANQITLTSSTGVTSTAFTATAASATFELLDGSGSVIGSAVTVVGSTALAASVTVGDITAGQTNSGAFVTFALGSGSTSVPGELTTLGATLPTSDTTTLSVAAAGTAAITSGDGEVQQNATVSSGLNITNQSSAAAALTKIDNAITVVNQQRANIGAYQNRLQFAASNASTASSNLSSAQAGIMDTNVALAMAQLSQDQILQQSGIAMLAQANAIPQALLKLFP